MTRIIYRLFLRQSTYLLEYTGFEGWESVVSMATHYRMDGSGIEFWWG
jgi:hypothetical protein